MIEQTLKLLLIDDDEDDWLITRDLLAEMPRLKVELEWCGSETAAFNLLINKHFDLLLVDYRLGATTGVELIGRLRQLYDVPIILLTGQGSVELESKAIELGAADYLVKGELSSDQLQRTLGYALDRYNAQKVLAEKEQRYRLLFDANPIPLWIFERVSYRFLAVNRATVKLYGYSEQEFLNMTIMDIRSEAEASRLVSFNEQGSKAEHAGIWQHRKKNGDELLVEIFVHDIGFDSKPARIVTAIDVTEKVKAENDSRRKDRAYRQLMMANRDALIVLDNDNNVQFINPAADEVFARSVVVGQTLPFSYPELHYDLFEITVQIKNEFRTLEIQVSETEWQDSHMRLLSLRDITLRKEALDKLRLFKRALEASNNGIVIADARVPDLPVIYVNKSFERITGYTAEDALGKNCRYLQGELHDEKAKLVIRQAIKEHKECHVLLQNVRKDGSVFWNSLYLAPVPDDDGQVHYYIGVQNDVSEQKTHEAELEYNASHDILTGLPNRALLQDRLAQSCQVSHRYQRNVAVLFIDLDGFKLVNDSLGHHIGDVILQEVGKRIKLQIRPGDTLARIGGDEFVTVLSDLAHEEDVVLVADRILDAVSQVFVVDGHEINLSASIGISLTDGSIDEPMQLIQQADIAMVRAKELGHNNYQWFSTDLNKSVGKQLMLRNQIQKALAAEEFELYYQPQIDARSGNVIALEALLRWPRNGGINFISPVEFIPVAEETGQIVPLSLWVFEQACRYVKTLLSKGMADLVIAVNVSSTHFQRSNFVGSVEDILKRTELPARHLELEITETVLFDNSESAIFKLGQLKTLGVKISIDDFGTGFSSLNYLKLLPIDKIKIDRSFIQDIVSDQRDAAISKAIIAMAHLLGLKVIAEGVETESQVAFLRKSLCDEYQGYYFARPMPVTELEPFLFNYHQRSLQLVGESDAGRQTILLLDDEENILHALIRLLRRDNYQILTATSADKAFELLALHDVQVILSDQRMPQMNGTEFLKRVKDLYPDTIRIVLSGYTDLRSVTESINSGAIYRFMTKPWNDVELRQEIQQAFVQYEKKKQVKDDR